MNKEHILQKLLGAKKHHPPETNYISRIERMSKNDKYVLSIPLWQDGKRKTQYIGSFSSLEEAQKAREFAFEKLEELTNIPEVVSSSNLDEGGEIVCHVTF